MHRFCFCFLAAGLSMAAPGVSQSAEARSESRNYHFDSGWKSNPTTLPERSARETVRFETAHWLRLRLDGTNLTNGSRLQLTSTADGAVQYFDAVSLAAYDYRTAYFNGNEVTVELFSAPKSRDNRVRVTNIEVGLQPTPPTESLCGGDDRTLSSDPRQGRQYPTGCTSWLISESVVMTAGHCTSNPNQQIHFNVPLSSSTGSLRFPPPEDQYPYDAATMQRLDAGVGADWAVVNTVRNSNTGLFAGQRQGGWYDLGPVPTSTSGQVIRITGYGTTSSPVNPAWNQAQKTHADSLTQIGSTFLRYIPDTTGGNSGSPVLHENTGLAIGIHSHAGCTSGGNQGTRIDRPDLQQAIASLLGGNNTAPAAPTNLSATASTGRIDLAWNDNASDESSYQVERSSDGNSFQVVATLGANETSWTDTGLPTNATRFYRVQAANENGTSAYSNIASATTPGAATDYFVTSQNSIDGTVSGSIGATTAADGVALSVTETSSGGRRPRNSLEHTWSIAGVPTGGTATLVLRVRQSLSADGDAFRFDYKTTNRRGKVSWNQMFTISSTDYASRTFVLPVRGDVEIRVTDTNNSRGAQGLDSVFIDQMLVRVQ